LKARKQSVIFLCAEEIIEFGLNGLLLRSGRLKLVHGNKCSWFNAAPHKFVPPAYRRWISNLLSRSELHPKDAEEQMTRQSSIIEDDKKPLAPKTEDRSHKPAEHIEETARLASSVETGKDPSKVRPTND
jgi:hypothetical protein